MTDNDRTHTCGFFLKGWTVLHTVRLWSPLQTKLLCSEFSKERFSPQKHDLCPVRLQIKCGMFSFWSGVAVCGLESPVWRKDVQMWCDALTQMHRTLIIQGEWKHPLESMFTAAVCVTQHLCWHMRYCFRRSVLMRQIGPVSLKSARKASVFVCNVTMLRSCGIWRPVCCNWFD